MTFCTNDNNSVFFGGNEWTVGHPSTQCTKYVSLWEITVRSPTSFSQDFRWVIFLPQDLWSAWEFNVVSWMKILVTIFRFFCSCWSYWPFCMYITVFSDQRLRSILVFLDISLGKWNMHVGWDINFLFVPLTPAIRFPCTFDAMSSFLSHRYSTLSKVRWHFLPVLMTCTTCINFPVLEISYFLKQWSGRL